MGAKAFFEQILGLASYFHKQFSKDALAERLALIHFAIATEGMYYEFKEQGFRCVLLRGPFLQWNGYVGIPEGHPLYGATYSQKRGGVLPEELLEVHGGLTYSANCLPGFLPDGLWYFGFDCSHLCDYSPLFSLLERDLLLYKTRSFAEAETRRLAQQLAELGRK